MNLTDREDHLLTGFRWSFSKLETASNCLYGFKRTYLDGIPDAENPFAQTGTLCHALLESFERGQREVYELLPAFQKAFPLSVTAAWPVYPRALKEKTYEKLCRYFRGFQGFDLPTTLMVEKKLVGEIAGRTFSGILDLVARDAEGRLVIIDHKSGGLTEYRGERLAHHQRQLLLYAALLRQTVGQQAAELAFNMIREGVWIRFPWTQSAEDEALRWAENVMKDAERKLNAYDKALSPMQRTIQKRLMERAQPAGIRRELKLTPRQYRRELLEMDEAAQIICGIKEHPGDYGCQHICSARKVCEEGGAP